MQYFLPVRIPPYWARGSYTQKKGWFGSDTFTAVGWSFDNIDEARAQADEKAKRIFDRWKNGQTLDRYEYGERHVCEEIVNRIEIDGAEIAIITRNRYGALILNAANVMFIDVDFEVDANPATGDTIPPGDEMEPKPVEKKAGFWKSLWPAVPRSDSPERRAERENEKRLRITQWFASNPERSGRVYRTAKGFRVILTDRPISPTSDETRQIFQAMKADPLYQKLTERQESYRARLTPKPWRLEVGRLQVSVWPRERPQDQKKFNAWLKLYESESHEHEVCHLVEAIGSPTMSKEIAAVVNAHDALTMNQKKRCALA